MHVIPGRAHRAWLALATVAMLAFAGCDDGPGGPIELGDTIADAADGDVDLGGGCPQTDCDGVATTCDGATLVRCAYGPTGCLARTETDCTADRAGGTCDDSGALARCASSCPVNDCTAEGARCSDDGRALIECTTDATGCLVETRTSCAAAGGTCELDGDDAACSVDPCDGVENCAVETRACFGDELRTCAPDENGCLRLAVETCDEVAGGFCDLASTTCAVDPCLDLDNACDAAGSACDGSTRVTCVANVDGCLVESRTDCAVGGGQCEIGNEGQAACTVDPCQGVADCTTAGTTCSADTLVTCAPDANGCLVMAELDCAATAHGRCESGAPASCVVDNPCDGIANPCAQAGVTCDGSTRVTCAANVDGCLVESRTDCAVGGGQCEVGGGGQAACTVDPCQGVADCTTAGTTCSADTLVTCAPDANGCLVMAQQDCAATAGGFCDAASPASCEVDPCAAVSDCDTAGARFCDQDIVEVCTADSSGCLVRTVTEDCAVNELVCDDSGASVSCRAPGVCPQFSRPALTGSPIIALDLAQSQDSGTRSCGGSAGVPDVSIEWTAPSDGCWLLTTEGSAVDTVLEVRDGCQGNVVACNDDALGSPTVSAVQVQASGGEAFVVVVDGYDAGDVGTIQLHASACPPPGTELFCTDGADNDGDTDVDCDDSDCAGALSCCADVLFDAPLGSTMTMSNAGLPDDLSGPCSADAGGREVVFRWTAPPGLQPTCYELSTAASTILDTVLYVGQSCGMQSVLACNDNTGDYRKARARLDAVPGQTYLIAVDAFAAGQVGDAALTISGCATTETSCTDGLDDDFDGDVDCDDTDCTGHAACAPPQTELDCGNAVDDDGDGDTDCADSDCTGTAVCTTCVDATLDDGVFTASTTGSADRLGVGCASAAGTPEVVYSWTPSDTGCWRLRTSHAAFDTSLAVYDDDGTCAANAARACNLDGGDGNGAEVRFEVASPGDEYLVVVEGQSAGTHGAYTLTVDRCPLQDETALCDLVQFQDADSDGIDDCLESVCSDGLDADENGLTDCADPLCGPACPENCADGIDNDADGLADCDDSSCVYDPACFACPASFSNAGNSPWTLTASNSGWRDQIRLSCTPVGGGADRFFDWSPPIEGCFTIETRAPAASTDPIEDTVLALLSVTGQVDLCDDLRTILTMGGTGEVACNDDADGSTGYSRLRVDTNQIPFGGLVIAVDGFNSTFEGEFELVVTEIACAETACEDGLDDDLDGLVDCADPDCANSGLYCGGGNVCGDEIVEITDGEACDDGGQSSGCDADCTLPECGDATVNTDAGEDCDDGNLDENDACSNTCSASFCGDGIVWVGVEQCDDGNTDDTDDCTTQCLDATCGDGIVGPGEQCDDGNATPADGCHGCQYTAPPAWNCDPFLYGDGFCDCGCGAVDPDCSSAAASACEGCMSPGSCVTSGPCSFSVQLSNNALCPGDLPEDCSSEGDEDGDGRLDCDDWECNAEPACQDLCEATVVGSATGQPAFKGNNAFAGDQWVGSCAPDPNSGGQDVAFQWTAPSSGCYEIDTRFSQVLHDTVLIVYDDCESQTELACDDNGGGSPPGTSRVELQALASSSYLIVVDGNLPDDVGLFDVNISYLGVNCPSSPCGNGIVDTGEDCDSFGVDTGGCDADCSFPVCGDGYRNVAIEECDDGNGLSGDGCDSCDLENWACDALHYGTGDGCHCGCGDIDPDCASTSVADCDVCDSPGSCDGTMSCSNIDPSFNAVCFGGPGFEICDNAIDDDGDQEVDCADTDCISDPACSGGGCGASQFTCSDGVCIESYAFCDTNPDCINDETSNPGCGPCGPGQFRCNDGQCIDPSGVCDGLFDCGDESDESPIYPDCPSGAPSGWTCSDFWYGDDYCDCGCGVPDIDCFDDTLDSCEYCNDSSMGGCADGGCSALDPGQTWQCLSVGPCGNGFLDAGEQCDDGGLVGGDGCSSGCQLESVPGWTCAVNAYGNNGQCDCGCGRLDPDCNVSSLGACAGTALPGACHDPNGANGMLNNEHNWRCDCDPDRQIECTTGECVKSLDLCPGSGGGGNPYCFTGDFTCSDASCIPASQFCDGSPVCPDLSDGTSNPGCGSCGPGSFTCSDSTCISPDQVCNQTPECPDGSDESPTYAGCPEICDNGLDDDLDGDSDCADDFCLGAPSCGAGSCGDSIVQIGEECDDGDVVSGDGCDDLCQDEPPTGWSCAAYQWSDGICDCGCGVFDARDCFDQTVSACNQCDQMSLGGCSITCNDVDPDLNAVCPGTGGGCGNGLIDAGEQCDDGNSIDTDTCSNACLLNSPPGWTCHPDHYGRDGTCDCGCGTLDPDCAGSLDIFCDTTTNPGACSSAVPVNPDLNWRCDCDPDRQFLCGDGSCTSFDQVCNGAPECGNGTDELGCAESPPACPVGDYACQDGQCIQGVQFCDGSGDCNSDESQSPACDSAKCIGFVCGNGVCIDPGYVCDGVRHCFDGSDEPPGNALCPESCEDGIDNNGDALVDCDDSLCNLHPVCIATHDLQDMTGSFAGDTTSGPDLLSGSCGGSGFPGETWRWKPPTAGTCWQIDTLGSSSDTVITLYDYTGSSLVELDCSDDAPGAGVESVVQHTFFDPGETLIVVDTKTATGDPYTLNITDVGTCP